jgi:hypothetical protein
MQKSFSDLEYAAKKKLTRRDCDGVTPWGKLHKLVKPFYSKVVGAGRPPIMHGELSIYKLSFAEQDISVKDREKTIKMYKHVALSSDRVFLYDVERRKYGGALVSSHIIQY